MTSCVYNVDQTRLKTEISNSDTYNLKEVPELGPTNYCPETARSHKLTARDK